MKTIINIIFYIKLYTPVNSDKSNNMPRKSTKVADVATDVATDVAVAVGASSEPESNTKKRAPVKRANKKMDSVPVPVTIESSNPSLENASSIQETTLSTPIMISDSINTFNIHIKHVSDDGSNIQDAFSTTYTHKGKINGNITTNMIIDNSSDNDSESTISSRGDEDEDEDEDSDYDRKFTNSSLTLPVSLNSTIELSPSPSPSPHEPAPTSASASGLGLCDDANPLYTTQQINYDILIPFVLVNMHASSRENIMALLHNTLISCIEGRCITEGFIKPHSTRIIDFKCGKIVAKNVQFNIVIECLVCNPQPQSIIACVAKNITQAGIRAISDDEFSPIVVYITRDFGIESDKTYYNSVKEGDKINVRVIGKRFEMNDRHIQIIGFLVQPRKDRLGIASSSLFAQSKNKKVVPVQTPVSVTAATSATPIETKKEPASASVAPSAKRGPRKSKNPLNIINDTDNNVITITYDPSIELPKEPKTKNKASKEPKAHKEPKAPKKSKKESGASVTNSAPVVEVCD